MTKPNISLYILSLWTFCSCSEDRVEESSRPIPLGEPIVGKPILPHENGDKNVSTIESNDGISKIKSWESNDSELSNGRIIEEGLVVNGVPISLEQNLTTEIIPNRLPPMEEDSAYSQIPFRDLTNFKYEVNWESDGKVFDFGSYAQRVPKPIRNQTGKSVAIEGFMIPTVVDENNKVKEFLLVPDQMSCCFGQTPEPNGWVVVSSSDGVEVLMDEVIRVTGEITVEERWDEEFFVGLYHLDCDDILGPSL